MREVAEDPPARTAAASPGQLAPIFILGAHKSGTSLVRSLFDSLGGFYVPPIETHPFHHLGWRIEYPIRRQAEARRSYEEVLASVRARLERVAALPAAGRTGGDAPLGPGWQLEPVMDHLATVGRERFDAGDIPGWIETYMAALHLGQTGTAPAAGKGPPDAPPDGRFRAFVEKSVEHAEFAPRLADWFPDAGFVHVVRNPYAALVSLRRFKTVGGMYPRLEPLVGALVHDHQHRRNNVASIPAERYFVVRFEDLVTDPDATMAELCSRLGLPMDPIAVRPTVGGQDWPGNSMRDPGYAGVSAAPATAWQAEIAAVEVAAVNSRLGEALDLLGYERRGPDGGLGGLLPARAPGERWTTFLRNRIYLLAPA